MAGRAMNVRASWAATLLLGALVAGCHRAPDPATAPLAGAAIGGPFSLVDQDGRLVTERAFAGRYRAIYFGYSYCPDVCPTTLQVLMEGFRRFAHAHPADAARLVPIFVSVDPARDTPAVLKRYVAAFGPQLVGLTGSADAIARTAKEYGVYYKAQPAKGASGYLVDHMSQAMLFSPDNKPIALLPTDQGADAVAATFSDWVR
ncbi:SCO family protein [Sphingomonas sp.]|uniref:SCO family protein n=1 Tax=Sphingomonas sp. TaxID=28214 RepID=UPI003B002943